MKLLLVDPEPRVSEGLTRLLLELEPTWEVTSARTTRRALELLASGGCDALITELGGDELDGTELLAYAAEQHPLSARLVLSAQPADSAPLQAYHLAHQMLPKPCAAETLHHLLTRVRDLGRLLPELKLRTLATQATALPSPPEVLERAHTLIDQKVVSSELGHLVAADPSLTAKLMQLACSGFICGSSKLADVPVALQQLGAPWVARVTRLGVPARVTTPLVTTSSQQRSLRIARLAASLARHPEDAAAAYLTGLVCDVGQLLLEQALPERIYLSRATAAQRGVPPHVVERSTWGATHADLSAYLLGLWGLPFQVVEAVAHHHAPERLSSARGGLTQLVFFAALAVEGGVPSPAALAHPGAEELFERARQLRDALEAPSAREPAFHPAPRS